MASTRKKKIVLVDLDRTLIDTDTIKAHADAIARSFGAHPAKAKKAYRSMGRTGFDPHLYFSHLIDDAAKRKAAIAKLKTLHREKKKYNFPDVDGFLKKLAARYTLILFTHGHPKHQMEKLKQSGLRRFFRDIVIVQSRDKEKEIMSFYVKHGADILLIDDSRDVARSAKKIGMKFIKVRAGWKDKNYFKDLFKKIRTKH